MTIDEQIENLKSLGLIIENEEYAKKILNDISYFRLIKAYSLGFKPKNGKYEEGVTFEQIVELYLFNANFRQVTFAEIEKIEVNVRCRIANYFAEVYGVLGYMEPQNFVDEEYPEKVDLTEQPPKGTDFIVRVSGDSMEPTYHNGDKLFVKEQPSIEIGEIGIFVVDGNAYVKELGVDRLISHNEKYSDIIINEYIRNECCGKVLGICEETF